MLRDTMKNVINDPLELSLVDIPQLGNTIGLASVSQRIAFHLAFQSGFLK